MKKRVITSKFNPAATTAYFYSLKAEDAKNEGAKRSKQLSLIPPK